MTIEQWKVHPNHPLIEVSDLGRIRSSNTKNVFTPHWSKTLHKSSRSYLILSFRVDTYKFTTKCVHRLVADTWLGPKPAGQIRRHLDGNRANNAVTNLAYGTYKQNEEDKTMPSPKSRRRMRSRKESFKRATKVRKLYERGLSLCDIAKVIDLDVTAISKIVNNKSCFDPNYVHIRNIQEEKEKITLKHSKKKHKFTPRQIRLLRKKYKSGVCYNQCYMWAKRNWKDLNIEKWEIWGIIQGHIYKWVK